MLEMQMYIAVAFFSFLTQRDRMRKQRSGRAHKTIVIVTQELQQILLLSKMSTRVMLVGAGTPSGEAASAFALNSLRAASRNDSSQLAGRVISMPHPRTGEVVKWMLTTPVLEESENSSISAAASGYDVMELQVAKVPAISFSSFFIEQHVQSNGALHIATRVDPALLLLPLLSKRKDKWTPLDQCLSEDKMA
eukprot:15588-Heterococcus_DN1.PRE.1